MSIDSLPINVGGTIDALTFTGGTSETVSILKQDGQSIDAVFDGSTVLDRTHLSFSSKEAKVKADAPNGYTQPRRTVVIKVPMTLANGNLTVNTVRLEVAYDVETSQSDIVFLLSYAAQCLRADQTLDFFVQGSLT